MSFGHEILLFLLGFSVIFEARVGVCRAQIRAEKAHDKKDCSFCVGSCQGEIEITVENIYQNPPDENKVYSSLHGNGGQFERVFGDYVERGKGVGIDAIVKTYYKPAAGPASGLAGWRRLGNMMIYRHIIFYIVIINIDRTGTASNKGSKQIRGLARTPASVGDLVTPRLLAWGTCFGDIRVFGQMAKQ